MDSAIPVRPVSGMTPHRSATILVPSLLTVLQGCTGRGGVSMRQAHEVTDNTPYAAAARR
jgi:hypothetical protein